MASTVGPITTPVSTGGAGSSTATITTTKNISGIVAGVYVKYNDSPPAGTTDVTVATQGTSPKAPARNILALTDAATDGWYHPVDQSNAVTGGAIANEYERIVIDDLVVVTIAQANDGDSVSIWLLLL